jgi:hypothetical protein
VNCIALEDPISFSVGILLSVTCWLSGALIKLQPYVAAVVQSWILIMQSHTDGDILTILLQVTAALYKVKMPDAIRGMWRALQKYDQEELNAVFSDPVSRKDYPDYYTDIAQPMDLKTLG